MGEGGFVEFVAEFKFAKIQNSHLCGGGFTEFVAEFKFAKIQNSHLWGKGGGFAEFVAEFKFAKIQNSHLWGGDSRNLLLSSNLLKSKNSHNLWVGGGSQNLMLSSNLLKSKFPLGGFAEFVAEFKFSKIQNSHFGGEGGGWWNQFPTFDAESKFAKKKFFCEKFSKFSGKNVPGNGFRL